MWTPDSDADGPRWRAELWLLGELERRRMRPPNAERDAAVARAVDVAVAAGALDEAAGDLWRARLADPAEMAAPGLPPDPPEGLPGAVGAWLEERVAVLGDLDGDALDREPDELRAVRAVLWPLVDIGVVRSEIAGRWEDRALRALGWPTTEDEDPRAGPWRFHGSDLRAVLSGPDPVGALRVIEVLVFAGGIALTIDVRPSRGHPVRVEDDLATAYVPEGGGGTGRADSSSASTVYRPAPPPEAHELRIRVGPDVVALALPDGRG